ncbi:MAG: hypothetical protein KAX33_09530 [Candidatus Lokiarchaeota archaeon]|nr:hypothetical protein [Candidatus Lokiarchaeota archaeon]
MNEKKINMYLFITNKLEILLKLSEVYKIDPSYRVSSREINEGLELETNGKLSDIKGINIDEGTLDNSLSKLCENDLIGNVKNGAKRTHYKSKFLYFILPRGNEISIKFWNKLKEIFPRFFSIDRNLDYLNENDVQEILLICEIIMNEGLINDRIKSIAKNLHSKFIHLKNNSSMISEELKYSIF